MNQGSVVLELRVIDKPILWRCVGRANVDLCECDIAGRSWSIARAAKGNAGGTLIDCVRRAPKAAAREIHQRTQIANARLIDEGGTKLPGPVDSGLMRDRRHVCHVSCWKT